MVSNFNDWFAIKITDSVSTMWCAYVFCCIALVSLPEAIGGGLATTISWIAQTFLQLVLLSIILVAGRLEGRKAEDRAIESHDAIMEALAILKANQEITHDALGVSKEDVDHSVITDL